MQTFKSYLQSLGHKSATISTHESAVYDFSNWCQDQNIEAKQATYNELLGYMQSLQKRGWQQRSIQGYIGSLGHYFNWLIAIDQRIDHPTENLVVKGIQRKKLHHIIAMQDLESLYATFKPNPEYVSGNYRIWHKRTHLATLTRQVAYGLMIWQGLGSGELSALRVQDIKLREGKIYIPAVSRQNERILQLQSIQILDLMEYLNQIRPEYLKLRPEPVEALFIGQYGGEWGTNFLDGLIKSLKSHNPTITSLQQIRTSVITHWLKTHNLRQVQYMAGHRYVSSTEAYLINDLDDLMEDINKFHPIE